MKLLSSFVGIVSIAGAVYAAPTANEDFVMAEDAKIRAIAEAAAITNAAQDASIGAIVARLDNENARFVSTNYNSQTKINSAFLEVSLRNEQTGFYEWVRVWDQLAIWNRWLGGESLDSWSGFYAWRTNVEAEINSKADRAWGFYDSTTGEWSPDGFTQISSPSILVASGMSYQRTVTSGGEVWVLKSNGMTVQTVGNTNSFFSVSDSDGNTFLEIVRGDRRIVAADASGVAVLTAYDPQALQIDYSIVSDAHPDLRICLDLNHPDWQDEGAAGCPATVSWSGHSGAWRAIVQPKSATSRLFVSATYGIGGEARVRILGQDFATPDYSTNNAQLVQTIQGTKVDEAEHAQAADEAYAAFNAYALSYPGPEGDSREAFTIFAQLDNAATKAELVNSTNALDTALSSRLSQESRASTNYTDSAIASADTSYTRTTTITNVNQSVAYVTNAPNNTLTIELPTSGETKDWIVYAYLGEETPLALPAAIWWMADEAYTNAIPSNTPTALYFSQVADGIYTLSRQELKSVQVSNP